MVSYLNNWFSGLNNVLYDNALNTFSREAPEDMVLIEIDNETLERMGHLPWSHDIMMRAHTRALKRLTEARAKAVYLDYPFNFEAVTRDSAVVDDAAARAINSNGSVVIPVVFNTNGQKIEERETLPAMDRAVAAKGHKEFIASPDGVTRATFLFAGASNHLEPHAALALLRITDPDKDVSRLGDVLFESSLKPNAELDYQFWYHIPYSGGAQHYSSYSYWRWITGDIPDSAVTDRVVFIGTTASRVEQVFATPKSGFMTPVSNIEIIMSTYEGLREGINIRVLPWSMNWLFASIGLTFLYLVYFRSPPSICILVTLLFIGLGIVGMRVALGVFQWQIAPASFLVCAACAYPLWMWRRLATVLFFLQQENMLLRQQGTMLTTMSASFTLSPEPVVRSLETLRETRERLQRASVERENFLHFLSHDMRSPQSAIIALIEMRSRKKANVNDDELFSQIKSYAQKTSKLAEEFVQMAKASSLTAGSFKELELTSLIDEAIDALWTFAAERKVKVKRNYEQTAFVKGSANLLSRAISNLIHNAIKFSPEDSEVTVSLIYSNGYWDFAVRDQGQGLSRDAQRHLLGMRSDNGGAQETGLVLGLAFVRTVIDRHGSMLKIDSAVGHGSTFYFRLKESDHRG